MSKVSAFWVAVVTIFSGLSITCWCSAVWCILFGDAYLSRSDPGIGLVMNYFALIAFAGLFAFTSLLAIAVTWRDQTGLKRFIAVAPALVLLADYLTFKMFGAAWYFLILQ